MSHQIRTVKLATGELTLTLEPGHIPLSRLLGFAARISSKRKFLFVSKILGKHYPVSPVMMSWSYRALAKKVLEQMQGETSIWIGMAETATGLGYGVFESGFNLGLTDSLFIQTTRYHLADQAYLEFQEAHSHATDFFLYYPEQAKLRRQFLNAQILVLIDDEISTGRTFLRLIQAYQQVNSALQKVFIVSLVNFAHANDRNIVNTEAGVEVVWIYLREGTLHFEDNNDQQLGAISVQVSSNNACKKHLLAWPGRLGMNKPIRLATTMTNELRGYFESDCDTRPILVLGSGECNAPAYLLGRALAAEGFAVKVQSTTRSPIYQGNDIQSIEQFEDNYDDGIPNFLYNRNMHDYREIIVCHETPLTPPLLERIKTWRAISAQFEMDPLTADHAKIHFSRP